MRSLLLFIVFSSALFGTALAAQFDNRDALEGLTTTRAVFDINQGDPKILALRLKLIEETYRQLREAGADPRFVLTFRGQASLFLTRGEKYIAPDDLPLKNEIELLLNQFGEHGMPLEQCAIAARLLNIDTADFLPGIKIVANGYTSLIGYQNRGYAFIPME